MAYGFQGEREKDYIHPFSNAAKLLFSKPQRAWLSFSSFGLASRGLSRPPATKRWFILSTESIQVIECIPLFTTYITYHYIPLHSGLADVVYEPLFKDPLKLCWPSMCIMGWSGIFLVWPVVRSWGGRTKVSLLFTWFSLPVRRFCLDACRWGSAHWTQSPPR